MRKKLTLGREHEALDVSLNLGFLEHKPRADLGARQLALTCERIDGLAPKPEPGLDLAGGEEVSH